MSKNLSSCPNSLDIVALHHLFFLLLDTTETREATGFALSKYFTEATEEL